MLSRRAPQPRCWGEGGREGSGHRTSLSAMEPRLKVMTLRSTLSAPMKVGNTSSTASLQAASSSGLSAAARRGGGACRCPAADDAQEYSRAA